MSSYDDKKTVLNDINLGRQELKLLQLDYECDELNGICYELYCIPSHNEQAYYAQIFRQSESIYISYAKPQINDLVNGLTINMYSLQEAKTANERSGFQGKIVCGYKKIDKSTAEYFTDLFEYIPEGIHWNEDTSICIDGTFQMIRVYSNNEIIKEMAFHNEPLIDSNSEVCEKLATLNEVISKMIVQ